MSSSWSGVLRFGFTSTDPGSARGPDLPRYACPDMTNKPGNWAKALGERYSAINNVLHFWYNRNGDVMYGVNGEDIGIFFTGVATNTPLWALMDTIKASKVGEYFLQSIKTSSVTKLKNSTLAMILKLYGQNSKIKAVKHCIYHLFIILKLLT